MIYTNNTDKLDVLLSKVVKNTPSEERNQLIKNYRPFIAKQVSLALGRYLNSETEDAFIIGMEAFNESIDKYNPERGSFLNFASKVIQSRTLDYIRKEQRYLKHEIPEAPSSSTFEKAWPSELDSEPELFEIQAEIQKFKRELFHYGISLEALIQNAPKHKKVRIKMIQLSQEISGEIELMHKIKEKRHLPMLEITLKFKVSKKILKSHREFIIACIIVFHENLKAIKSYLKSGGEA